MSAIPQIPPANQLDVSVGDELEASPWATLESDPGVFTELAAKMGIRDVQVEEIFEMSPECFERLEPIYGLIFLFQWRDSDTVESEADGIVPEGLCFMNQVIDNACATQALLSIALNCPTLDIGRELRGFKEFTKDFSPAMKGLALSNSHHLRTSHNSFSRATDLPVLQYPVPKRQYKRKRKTKNDDDNGFHFVSFLPFESAVWELDGLKKAPKWLGPLEEGSSWAAVAAPHIQTRMAQYSNEAIQFNLMAVVQSRLAALQKRLAQQSGENDFSREIQEAIMDQHARREEIKADNERRRFNYVPFIKRYLELLHDKGLLTDVLSS
ncbi:ubiquitin carboxyl-terminal hydrolase [Geranomyces variabilis]|nr:ubiquitin carboxyl-terminal hydrolase [Geranomyces variabilis]KAJ3138577.1 Ubiquitin carboxyl-terminal hydrolase bap1 [Geranomyces variabilis]